MNGQRPGQPGTAPWWALGLNLVERLTAAPVAQGGQGDAHGRLDEWRTVFDQHDPTGFERRLAQSGLDESGLLALLTETPDALADRATAPAWARFVDTALAAEPVAADRHEIDPQDSGLSDWEVDFAHVLAPLVAEVDRQLRAAAGADLECAVTGMIRQLRRTLARLAARTFVLELNLARISGTLNGRTPQDRFTVFVRRLADRSNLRALFTEYPVLGRLVGETCRQSTEAGVELMTRLRSDRTRIVGTIFAGVDPGPLVAVEPTGGDLHERGRFVALLRFDSGRTVVYKPRPLDMHHHFGELVAWYDGKLDGIGLRTVQAVRGDRYGWLEFVEPESCGAAAEVAVFYRRLGALLALLYAVDGVDMHYENLIAAGDQPVLVDVETLLHPVLARPVTAGQDPAAALVAHSVLRVGLLPASVIGDLGSADISGLGGDGTLGEGSYPSEGVGWDGTRTDTMRLRRRPVKFVSASNRPRLNGVDADPAAYQSDLLHGFRTGYRALMSAKDELVARLARFGADAMRVLVRPTRLYANVLDESAHPDVLRDALDRDKVFDLLWVDSLPDRLRARLIAHEIADLWAGDIPTFSGRPDSRDLWTSAGRRIPDALDRTGLHAAEAKIDALSPADQQRQEWLIAASFAAYGKPATHTAASLAAGPIRAREADQADPEIFLAAAKRIGDDLVASAVPGHGRVNWLGMEIVEDHHWVIMPAGAGLADGYSGIALFLAQLAGRTGDERYRDVARRAIDPVADLIEVFAAQPDLADEVGVGGYHGLGGIAYALSGLSDLLDDPDLLVATARTIDVMAAMNEGLDQSVATGRAGGLAAVLAVWQRTGLTSARDLAYRYADSLLSDWRTAHAHTYAGNSTVDRSGDRSGFARGLAGVGWALSRFTTVLGGEHYRNAGHAAIVRDLGSLPAKDAGWCTGLAGVATASAAAYKHRTGTDLDLLVRAIAHHGPIGDMSLCHGELGVLEALGVMETVRDEASAEKHRRTASFAASLQENGPVCGTPAAVPTPGMLTGLAGIGHGLLRLACPTRIPSVLRLDTQTTASITTATTSTTTTM